MGVIPKVKLDLLGDVANNAYEKIIRPAARGIERYERFTEDIPVGVRLLSTKKGRAELRRRNLGFFVEPPQFGLAPKRIAKIAEDEAERFASGFGGLAKKPGPGDVEKIAAGPTRFIGREAWELLGGPGVALDRSIGSVLGSSLQQSTKRNLPEFYQANKTQVDSLAYDRGIQEGLGAAFGIMLPSLTKLRLAGKIPAAARIPAELVYPGGAAEAAAGLAKAGGRAAFRGSTVAAKAAAYGIGTAIEGAAPRVAKVLTGPHVRAGERAAAADWPRYLYEASDGGDSVVGLEVERGRLQSLIGAKRQEYYRKRSQAKRGIPVGPQLDPSGVPLQNPKMATDYLDDLDQNINALQALLDTMQQSGLRSVILREEDLYKYSKNIAHDLKTREDLAHAVENRTAAQIRAERASALLDQGISTVAGGESTALSLRRSLRSALFGEKSADPEIADELLEVRRLADEVTEQGGASERLTEQAATKRSEASDMLSKEISLLRDPAGGVPDAAVYSARANELAKAEARVAALEEALGRAAKGEQTRLGAGRVTASSGSQSLTRAARGGAAPQTTTADIEAALKAAKKKADEALRRWGNERRKLYTSLTPKGSPRRALYSASLAAQRRAAAARKRLDPAYRALAAQEKSLEARGKYLDSKPVYEVTADDIKQAEERLARVLKTAHDKQSLKRARDELRQLRSRIAKGAPEGEAQRIGKKKLEKTRAAVRELESEVSTASMEAKALGRRLDEGEGLSEVASEVARIDVATGRYSRIIKEAEQSDIGAARARRSREAQREALKPATEKLQARLKKAQRAVVSRFHDALFRPATSDPESATYYELASVNLAGSRKDPSGLRLVAVLTPVKGADLGNRPIEVRRVADLTQARQDLAEAEASFDAAHRAAKRAGTQSEKAATRIKRTQAKELVAKLRGKVTELESGAPDVAGAAARAADPKARPIRVPVDELDTRFVRYRMTPRKRPRSAFGGTGVADPAFRRALADRQILAEKEADAVRRRDILIAESNELSRQPRTPVGDPAVQAVNRRRTAVETEIKAVREELEQRSDQLAVVDAKLARTDRSAVVDSLEANRHLVLAQGAEWKAREARAAASALVQESVLPTPTSFKSGGELPIAVTPDYGKRGETLAEYNARLASIAEQRFLEIIEGRVRKFANPTEDELQAIHQDINRYYLRATKTKFFEGMGEIFQRIEAIAPNMSVEKAFRMLVAPHDTIETALDTGAFKSGLPRWARRVLGGTGFRVGAFQGATATYFDGEAQAAYQAQATYGYLRQLFIQTTKGLLKAAAAGGSEDALQLLKAGKKKPTTAAGRILGMPAYKAANILKIGDDDRLLRAVFRHYAKPIDSPAWKYDHFGRIDALGEDLATSPELRQQAYDFASGEFLTAALHPELFDIRSMPAELRHVLEHYRDGYYRLERSASSIFGLKWSHAPLVRQELRESLGPSGTIYSRTGGAPAKARGRTLITDLVETLRRQEVKQQTPGNLRTWLATNEGVPSAISGRSPEGTRQFPLSLDRIYLSGQDLAEAYPGIIYRRMNDAEFERKLANQLNDSSKPGILRSEEGWNTSLGPNDFKGATPAEKRARSDDWKKLVGMLQRDEPTGPWKVLDNFRRAANAVGLSVLIGDLAFFGIQVPFMLALNPRAGFKAMGHFFGLGGNVWSDQKFATWTASHMDIIEPMIGRGSGLGMEAYVGASFRSGSMWEHLPLTRPFGKFARYLNDVQFNRMMLVFKVSAMQTQLDIIHALRMVGPATAIPYIDGLPGLKELNKSVDLMNATPVEVFDALIRLQNNQFGGVPRSQSQLGIMRDFVEHLTLIVPGFFRARAGLIGQMSRAARNPSSIEGWLAMNIISREMLYTQLIGGGVSAMSGNLDQWTEVGEAAASGDINEAYAKLPPNFKTWLKSRDEPNESMFFSAAVGDAAAGEYVRVAPSPGAMQLYVRLTNEMAKMAKESVGPGRPSPEGLKEVATRFAKGRENPALAVIVEQYEGKDFFGRNRKDLRSRAVGAISGVAPIWMGELMTGIEDQAYSGEFNPTALGVDTAGEFLGYSHRPAVPSEQLNNRFRAWQERSGTLQGREPIDWWDATSPAKQMAKEADPDIMHAESLWLRDKARKETDRDKFTNAVFSSFEQKMGDLDTQQAQNSRLAEGGGIDFEEWAERQKDLGKARSSAAENLRQDLMEAGIDLEEKSKEKLEQMQIGGKGPLVALALAEYRAVEMPTQEKDYTLDDGTSIVEQVPDFDRLDAEKEAVLARYPKAVQDEVRGIVGPTDPMEIRWKQSHKSLDAYLDEIPKYTGLSVSEGQYVDFLISSMRAVEKRVRQEGISVTRKKLYLKVLGALAQQGKVDRGKAAIAAKAYAWALDSDKRLVGRNPDNLRFLRDNSDMLLFFPWLRGDVPQKMWRFLPEEVRAQIDIGAIEERELGQAGVSAVA